MQERGSCGFGDDILSVPPPGKSQVTLGVGLGDLWQSQGWAPVSVREYFGLFAFGYECTFMGNMTIAFC